MEPAEARGTAFRIAQRLVDEGVRAVVLSGSVVRGEASPESDIDLYAFGPRSGYVLERHGAHLISITWRSPDDERAAFESPSKVGAVIPAWRRAQILVDEDGIAAELKREAERWTWDAIAPERLSGYVAEEIAGLAEEVHKLVNALRGGRTWTAAVQRNVLTLHLAPVLAVHLRLLYETENRLWDLVAEGMGEEWRLTQDEALSATLIPSCLAALRLYALAADAVDGMLDERQREVVAYAASLTP